MRRAGPRQVLHLTNSISSHPLVSPTQPVLSRGRPRGLHPHLDAQGRFFQRHLGPIRRRQSRRLGGGRDARGHVGGVARDRRHQIRGRRRRRPHGQKRQRLGHLFRPDHRRRYSEALVGVAIDRRREGRGRVGVMEVGIMLKVNRKSGDCEKKKHRR